MIQNIFFTNQTSSKQGNSLSFSLNLSMQYHFIHAFLISCFHYRHALGILQGNALHIAATANNFLPQQRSPLCLFRWYKYIITVRFGTVKNHPAFLQ